MQSSPLYTSCLFSIPLNDHIIDIEYLGIFREHINLFLLWMIFQNHLYFYFFNQRFQISIINRWCFIRFSVLIKLQYLSVFRRHYNITEICIFNFFFMRVKFVFLFQGNEDNSNKNHQYVLMLYLLITDNSLMQNNAILLRLEPSFL